MGQRSTWKETCAVSVFIRLNTIWHQIAFSVEVNTTAFFSIISIPVPRAQAPVMTRALDVLGKIKNRNQKLVVPVWFCAYFQIYGFLSMRTKSSNWFWPKGSCSLGTRLSSYFGYVFLNGFQKSDLCYTGKRNLYKPFRVTQESNWISKSLGKWIAVNLEAGYLPNYTK